MAPWNEGNCPEAVQWYVAALGAEILDDAQLDRAAERFRPGSATLKLGLAQRRGAFGSFTPQHVHVEPEGLFVLEGLDARGRQCTVLLRIDPAAPYAIRSHAIYATPAAGYVVREGGPADYSTCADVESRTPTVSAEGSYLLSRGDDFASYLELQGARLWVVEHEGRVVGWTAAAQAQFGQFAAAHFGVCRTGLLAP